MGRIGRVSRLHGYTVPWYSVHGIDDPVIAGEFGSYACFLRQGDRIFLTSEITDRGVEATMVPLKLLDMTVYGRKETWEDSPAGWPKLGGACSFWRKNGRPVAQWTRPGATPIESAQQNEPCH